MRKQVQMTVAKSPEILVMAAVQEGAKVFMTPAGKEQLLKYQEGAAAKWMTSK